MGDSHGGGCHCGAVTFAVAGLLRGVVYCHCTQCRKQTGHYYAATSCRLEDLTIAGAEHLTWYRASETARRGFCSTCGSALFWQRDGGDAISILAGSFDRPTRLRGERHIFVADKGDYYDIDDGLPQFAGAG